MNEWGIEHLADRPDAILRIARWQYDQWGHLSPGDSIGRRVRKLQGHLNRDCIPLTLVAFAGSDPVGSASLVKHDLPERKELSPWLASVFVTPAYRKKGIGSLLVEQAVLQAHRLKITPLYLFTWDREHFYEKLGWRVRERTSYKGTEIVIMEIYPGEEIAKPAAKDHW